MLMAAAGVSKLVFKSKSISFFKTIKSVEKQKEHTMKRFIVSLMVAFALVVSGIAVTPTFTTDVAHADGGGGSE